jgi:hypothetical protein
MGHCTGCALASAVAGYFLSNSAATCAGVSVDDWAIAVMGVRIIGVNPIDAARPIAGSFFNTAGSPF